MEAFRNDFVVADKIDVTRKPSFGEKKQLRAILITPTTTWPFTGDPYTTGTQKAAIISNTKNCLSTVYSLSTWN